MFDIIKCSIYINNSWICFFIRQKSFEFNWKVRSKGFFFGFICKLNLNLEKITVIIWKKINMIVIRLLNSMFWMGLVNQFTNLIQLKQFYRWKMQLAEFNSKYLLIDLICLFRRMIFSMNFSPMKSYFRWLFLNMILVWIV